MSEEQHQHINMKSNNYPDEESSLEQEARDMQDKILASEGDEIVVWSEDYPGNGKIVFLTIGNTTINMPEEIFYALTRSTQIASKKLLNMD